MKKGQEYTGRIEQYEFPNKGIVTYHEEDRDTKVVIKGTLPGQTVRFTLSKKRAGKCEGRLLAVTELSELEDRVPFCPNYRECGGCTYQRVSYDSQLKLKGDMVKRIMDEAVDGEYEFEGIMGSPFEWAYRNKMEFSFGDEYKDGPLALGLHKKGSFHDIVTVDECRIVNSDYNNILTEVLRYFDELGFPFYHKMKHTGYLRHLVVRRAVKTGEILINIVTTGSFEQEHACRKYREDDVFKELSDRLRSLDLYGTIEGVLHTVNDSLADVVQSDRTDIIYGRDYITEKLLGLEFKISAFSFFQTNTLGAEVLYSKAREYVGETDEKVVFDLYSGTGTIAQIIAPVARKVIGVEIVEEAVEAAKINAELNGLANCSFIAGDVLRVIDDIEEKPDLIILDPPRDGIHPKALTKIIGYGVEKMVYISCKPTSLARDLAVLQENGYRVEKVCAVDMFPQTYHVETVILLSQRKADDRIEVEIELDELDLTSAESKATYEEIKEYVLKEHGLKVSNLYISQVKRKCGIEVGMNYNLPKSEGARGPVDLCSARTGAGAETSRQPKCPEEKKRAIKDALEHFGMV